MTNSGGATVTARGVCWSTSHNPTISNSHTTDGTGTGSFTSSITGLTAGTLYHVRAYATNSAGTAYGADVTFTTQQVPTYTISVSANPSNGGSVTGGGSYQQGQSCTVSATAYSNYTFTNWTENGNVVSTNASYQFDVTANRTLVANFTIQANLPTVVTNEVVGVTSCAAICVGNVLDDGGATVTERGICWSTSHNPSINGLHISVGTGMGSFNSLFSIVLLPSTTYYVRAYAINSAGTGYGSEVSFETQSAKPIGSICGLFSVSSIQQVYFSQGNLQYIGNTSTWKFADYQWQYLGNNGQGVSSQAISRDLFGWGTSGYNHGAVCYQPWSTNSTPTNYHAYGSATYHLYNQNGRAEWGYNEISNGGNQTNSWRTLKKEEWNYVLNQRNTTSGIRFAKAKVNGINGIILLPDTWSALAFNINYPNQGNASYSSNSVSLDNWTNLFEPLGAVFLPAAGMREGNSVFDDGSAYYWSSEYANGNSAYDVYFRNDYCNFSTYSGRHSGYSVRLVKNY